jgi:alginate O-acetyltransferase complex protein AlgI
MLFSSVTFIFQFLPVVLAGFLILQWLGFKTARMWWLVAASLGFYGWWNPPFVSLLILSMLGNFLLGLGLARRPNRLLLICGIGANLGALGYFKYANFFLVNIGGALGVETVPQNIILPLAISFFTFQQIAYLVDVHQGKAQDHNFIHYSLFISFFPQLIAGPIVHHKEVMPQFDRPGSLVINKENVLIGGAIFIIGLYKKVVFADGISIYADSAFNGVATGTEPGLIEAWAGALAYTFQIYFDFSGYSDMAIGLARIFGIILPLNFHSPYKATNIIDFWRRWHITLSRFFRDYVYFPLGGSRKGQMRQAVNIMITMLITGLWHGAGWSFIVWGGAHGILLMINHVWNSLRKSTTHSPLRLFAGRGLTFLTVVTGWVLFRAGSFDDSATMLSGMVGLNGLGQSADYILLSSAYPWFAGMLLICWFAPNTQEIFDRSEPAFDYDSTEKKTRLASVGVAGCLLRNRIYWLAPMLLVSMGGSILIVLAKGAAMQDFVYMVF